MRKNVTLLTSKTTKNFIGSSISGKYQYLFKKATLTKVDSRYGFTMKTLSEENLYEMTFGSTRNDMMIIVSFSEYSW